MTAIPNLVKNVFKELVETTKQCEVLFEDPYRDVETEPHFSTKQNSFRSIPTEPAVSGTSDSYDISDSNQLFKLRKKLFWHLSSKLSLGNGSLRLETCSGAVVLRRRDQAKAFGRSLFAHVNRTYRDNPGGVGVDDNRSLSSATVCTLSDSIILGLSVSGNNGHLAGSALLLGKEPSAAVMDALNRIFEPTSPTQALTEHDFVKGLCLVYKESRFCASSLEDFGQLHSSLRVIVDALFWFTMLFVMLGFLQLNVSTYVLPFVTMGLTLSFALGPLIGNLFLATVYVLFMMPYDIGNKIAIGSVESTQLVGFVKGVSLLYTTLTTLNNETIKVPNHTLFSEKIINYFESAGVIFEINIGFNLSSAKPGSQIKIDDFFQRVKEFMLQKKKSEWQSCLVCCVGISDKDCLASYKVWATHRESLQDRKRPFQSRTELLQYMQRLQTELQLTYDSPPVCIRGRLDQ